MRQNKLSGKLQRNGLRTMVAVTVGLFASVAMASPNFGGQCTSCHQDSTNLPAAHPPISSMESAQCLSCHQTNSNAATGVLAPSLADMQTQHQTHTSEQEQAQDQLQTHTQTQLMIGYSGEPREEHRGQTGGGHGNQAHEGQSSPWSYGLTLGILSSSDIEQHRSNSIFHGSSDASFFQPGAAGGGHEAEDDAVAGNRVHLGLRADYELGLGEGTSLTYGARLNFDEFLNEDFNRTSARLSVRWKAKSEASMLQLTSYLQQTMFEGAPENTEINFTGYGINLNYHQDLTEGTMAIAALRARQRDYDGESTARNAEFSLSLGLRNAHPDFGILNYGLSFVSRNNAKKEHSRYNGPSVFASIDKSVSDTMTLGLSGELGVRTYKGPDSIAFITRYDRFAEAGFSIRDTRLKILSVTPEFACHYNLTHSNIDRFDGNSSYCALALERRF